jgi:hypothetical protein
MTTQQKIRNVRRRLHELMALREKTVIVNPNDQTEKECTRLATVLCDHEKRWQEEKAAIDRKRTLDGQHQLCADYARHLDAELAKQRKEIRL